MLSGHLEESHTLAEHALALAREHQERDHQAYALRLLGDIAARPRPGRGTRHAPAAGALSPRSRLYSQTGRATLAHAALSTAIELYRAMDMTFWLPAAEAALAQVDQQ